MPVTLGIMEHISSDTTLDWLQTHFGLFHLQEDTSGWRKSGWAAGGIEEEPEGPGPCPDWAATN